MAVIRNLVVKIAADISSLSKGFKEAQSKLESLSDNLGNIGGMLSLKVTAPLVMLGKTALNTAADFEQSMANAASVSGASSEELERMTLLARVMGKETVFSASQAADAMYYMASAGYKVEQMENSIAAVLNLAAATQSELAFSTEVVIATLNQFQLDSSKAERVTNVFAAAIGNSQATLDKLKNSLGYVGPVANSLGWELEEAAGALSILYNAGYDGSTAGTSLRQALVSLMNPTTKAQKIFEELGITLEKLDPTTNKFSDIVNTLKESGLTTAQAMEIFGARAGPGMMALLAQGGDAIADMTKKITGTDAATEMAEKQLNTFKGSVELLKSEAEELAITAGNILVPVIRKLINTALIPATEKLNALSESTKEMTVKIGIAAAAIGPLLIALSKVIKAVSVITKVLGLIASPIGLIIAAIGLVVAALVYLYKTNEVFRNKILEIWERIKEYILSAIAAILKWWESNKDKIIRGIADAFEYTLKVISFVIEIAISLFNKLVSSIKYLWDSNEELRNAIGKIWGGIREFIVTTVKSIISWWKANWEKLVDSVDKVFNTIWNVIIKVVDGILKSITVFLNYLSPIWEQIKGIFASLWDVIRQLWIILEPILIAIGAVIVTLYGIFIGTINGIIQALGPLVQAIVSAAQFVINILGAIISLITGDLDGAWEYLKSAGQSFVDFFVHLWEGLLNFVRGFAQGVKNFFLSLGVDLEAIFITIGDSIANFFSGIWKGITDFCSNIWKSVTGVFGDVKNFITNLISEAFNWGKNLITSIGDGIRSAVDYITNGVKSIGQAIADFLGFSSPTKKGAGRFADKWMPNLMDMLRVGIDKGLPDIESSLSFTSDRFEGLLNINALPARGEDQTVNSLVSAISNLNGISRQNNSPVELSIDGQVFARLIMPSLSKEFKRQGVKITGGI